MRFFLVFPFQLLYRCGEAGLRIIGFMIGFCFGLLRFMTGRIFTLLFGAFIGLLVGTKLFSGKRR
jgi:hypothetical protein